MGGRGKRPPFGLCVLACALLSGAVSAQGRPSPEDGIPVGRWILRPRLSVGYTWDSNIFRTNETGAIRGESRRVVGDQALRSVGEIDAFMPIRNSYLRLSYNADYREFDSVPEFDRDLEQTAESELNLELSNGYRLILDQAYTRGVFSIREIDEGGELVFDGEAFTLKTLGARVERNVRGRRSFQVNLLGRDLDFDANLRDRFFEYSGFAVRGEYREPLGDRYWVTATVARGDEDNVRPSTGDKFREEESTVLQLGFRGILGEDRPFFVRIGHTRLEFPLARQSEYSGPSWQANARFMLGERTSLDVDTSRIPRPSSFFDQNFYVSERWRARAAFRWRRHTTFGAETTFTNNRYGASEPRAEPELPAGAIREDERWSLGAYADIMLTDHYGLRVDVERRSRDSNYAVAVFDATIVSASFLVGWQ